MPSLLFVALFAALDAAIARDVTDVGSFGLMDLSYMNRTSTFRLTESPHRHQLTEIPIPESFDARQAFPSCAQSISDVRNQGSCGSCWAFGAVEALADRLCIASDGNVNVRLSAQSLIDCDKEDDGCQGGYLDNAWEGLVTRGALQDICDPYEHCAYPPYANCTPPSPSGLAC